MQCKNYNQLPFEGGVLDQPEHIMLIMTYVEAGYRLGDKSIKDYTKKDAHDKIVVDTLLMIENGGDVAKFLKRACGNDIIENGRINEDKMMQFGLEWIAPEVNQWLQNSSYQ